MVMGRGPRPLVMVCILSYIFFFFYQLFSYLYQRLLFPDELPDLDSDADESIIPSAQKQKHTRPRSPIPDDANVIEISDVDQPLADCSKRYLHLQEFLNYFYLYVLTL